MIRKLIRYQARNILRSRWVPVNTLFFLLLGETLFQASGSAEKMQVNIMSVVLIVIPLISVVYGTIYIYGQREFFEVLASQPVRRRDIYVSAYLVMGGTLAGCFILGAGIPLALHAGGAGALATGLLLLAAGSLLALVFTGLAFTVAVGVQDRTRGIGVALMLWFYFSLLYDGIVLYAFYALGDYPAEPIALAFTFLNPVDLARIFLTLQFDVSALMGYTGAVLQDFFGGGLGALLTLGAMLLWAAVPFLAGLRLFRKKDF